MPLHRSLFHRLPKCMNRVPVNLSVKNESWTWWQGIVFLNQRSCFLDVMDLWLRLDRSFEFCLHFWCHAGRGRLDYGSSFECATTSSHPSIPISNTHASIIGIPGEQLGWWDRRFSRRWMNPWSLPCCTGLTLNYLNRDDTADKVDGETDELRELDEEIREAIGRASMADVCAVKGNVSQQAFDGSWG